MARLGGFQQAMGGILFPAILAQMLNVDCPRKYSLADHRSWYPEDSRVMLFPIFLAI